MIISKDFHFEAAHHLRDYKGKCAQPHGHSYYGTIWVENYMVDSTGFIIDYNVISEMINTLDHRDLNEFPEFKELNPTAENIASEIMKKISEKCPGMNVAVKLHETATSMAFVCNNNEQLKFLAV